MSDTRIVSESVASNEFAVPGGGRVAFAIGRVTFREILRDKILYNVIFFALILLALGLLAAHLSLNHPERVVLDMGQTAISLSCAMIAAFLGAGMIGREIERRTIHLALSHPITRGQFIVGKFLGIAGVLTVNWALLSIAYLAVLAITAPADYAVFQVATLAGLLLALVQSLLLASAAIFFSSFTTTSLAAIFCIGAYLVGHSATELGGAVDHIESPAVRGVTRVLVGFLPDLEHFNLSFKVTYGLAVTPALIAQSLAYGLAWVLAFLLAAGFLIARREI